MIFGRATGRLRRPGSMGSVTCRADGAAAQKGRLSEQLVAHVWVDLAQGCSMVRLNSTKRKCV